MRLSMIVGIVLIAVGGYVLARGLSYSSDRSVFKVGDFEATLEERRSVPPWAGGLAIVAGVVLVAMGSRKRQ